MTLSKFHYGFFTVLVLSLIFFSACVSKVKRVESPWDKEAIAGNYKGFPRGNALISVHELRALQEKGEEDFVVLAAENLPTFLLGHIPGSFAVDRPAYEAAAENQEGVAGNLLDEAGFTAFAQDLGINPDTTLIVYDGRTNSTRLWWAFTYYGHENVRVLDGGLDAWREASYPVSNIPTSNQRERGGWIAEVTYPNLRVRTPEIVALGENQRAQLWDTREKDEYTGERQLRGASRAGRIPGAEFNWWGDFKNSDNLAEWKNYEEIQIILTELGYEQDKDQYFYCQRGIRSTHGVFALYLAGWDLERLHNYDDSWIGYSQDENLPIVSGSL